MRFSSKTVATTLAVVVMMAGFGTGCASHSKAEEERLQRIEAAASRAEAAGNKAEAAARSAADAAQRAEAAAQKAEAIFQKHMRK